VGRSAGQKTAKKNCKSTQGTGALAHEFAIAFFVDNAMASVMGNLLSPGLFLEHHSRKNLNERLALNSPTFQIRKIDPHVK
jgi:hypothetical protein